MSIAQFAGMDEEQARRFMADAPKQRVRSRIAELVGSRSVVDVGCGKGEEVSDLFTPSQYTGVDCSPELVSLAKRANPGYHFIVGDGRDLSGSWDVGVVKAVLEHVPAEEALAIYEHVRSLVDVLYVAWHTEPGEPQFRTYAGELGTMQQNRHDHALFDGMTAREVVEPHVLWTVR